MTNSLENIDKKKLTMERLTDAMDDIFKDEKMKSLWGIYEDFINNDESYNFSLVERLELQVYGTLFLGAAQALAEMEPAEVIEEMRRQSSPYMRMMEIGDKIDSIRKEGKKRAEEGGSKESPFTDKNLKSLEMETDDEKVSFKREKKDNLEDYEELK